jgi:hypothetical protein
VIDTLKKIGLPATVSAIIAALITILPFIFKIDERYAKEEDVKAQAEQTEKAINNLALEIGRLAGSQEVMITLMGKKEVRVVTTEGLNQLVRPLVGKTPDPKEVTVEIEPSPTSKAKLNAIKRDTMSQQERLRNFSQEK